MKRTLAFLLSLLLMMSMLPAAALATDGAVTEASATDAPVAEEVPAEDSAVQNQELPSGTAPTNFRWDKCFWNGSETDVKGYLTFDAAEYENYLVQFFKKAETAGEEDTFLFPVQTFCYPFESSVSANLFARDLATPIESGTYYAVVTPMGDDQNTGEGEPVKSPEWSYTRPSVTLTTADPQWDEANQAATWANGFTDTSAVERYWVRYYCNPSENSFDGAEYVNGQNYLPTDTPPYAIPKTILTAGGDGWYFFTVQAWSGDITKAVSGEASDVSSGLYFDAPAPDLSVANAKWGEDMTLTWTDTSLKPEAVDRYYVLFYYNPNENSFSGAEKISGYNYYAKNAPHTVPAHTLANGGTGWWFFKVQVRATSASGVADSQWSDFSDGYYYTPVLPEVPAATDLQWHVSHWSDGSSEKETGAISFAGTVPEGMDYVHYRVDVYRKGQTEDVCIIENYWLTLWCGESYANFNPLYSYEDLFTTGTYYFTVTPMGDGINTSDGPSATSPDWVYVRPAKLPLITSLAWNADMSLSWSGGDGADYYGIQFQYVGEDDRFGEDIYHTSGNYWLKDGKTTFYPEDWLLHENGTGKYYFRMRAMSEDITEAISGDWSDWSPAFDYTKPAILTPTDLCWDPTTGEILFDLETGDDSMVDYYLIRFYYSETNTMPDSSVARYRYYPQSKPFYIPKDVSRNYGEGYYWFSVRAVTNDRTKALSGLDDSVPSGSYYYKSINNPAAAPVDLEWNYWSNSSGSDGDYELGAITFGRQNTGTREEFRVDFYRKDTSGDEKVGTLWTYMNESRSSRTLYPFTDLDDVFTTGTYYFTVTPLGDGETTSEGQPVCSADWAYTRPDVKLGVSNAHWGPNMSINWTDAAQNAGYADYYQLRYQFVRTGDTFQEDNWDYGTSYHPGDSSDFPYPPEDLMGDRGDGKYYFQVRAISHSINDAVYSDWSDWSEAYTYTKPASTLTVSDLQWNGNILSWNPDFPASAPLAGYRIYVYEDADLAVSDPHQWWDCAFVPAGETFFTMPQWMLENLRGDTWYFTVATISANPAAYNSNYGTVPGIQWTYTAPTTPAPAATDPQWHLRRWSESDSWPEVGMISFGGTVPQNAERARFQVDIYRKEANGSTHIGTTHINLWEGDTYTCVQPFEHFADKFITGTYYFTVTSMGDGINTCDGPAVASADWTYTRPNVTLAVSSPKWSSDMSISWTDASQNSDYLDYYDLQYQFVGSKESFDPDSWNYGTSYSPNSGDVLYPPEALLKDHGNGKYYFRVRALAEDVTAAVPSNWSDWSDAFTYTKPSTTLTVSNVQCTGNTISWTPDFNTSAPLLRYNITVYRNASDAVSEPNNWHDRYIVPADATSFTLDPWMVENLADDNWYFVINTVSSNPTTAASNFGLGQGCAWTYTPPANKLGAPTDLKWHIDFDWQWDDDTQTDYQVPVERKGSIAFKRPVDQNGNFIDQAEYDIQLYRIEPNGTHVQVNNAGCGIGSTSPDTHVADHNFIYGDFPSGTYYFKVRCRADGMNYASSDWVDSRDFPNGIYEYTQPTKRLPAPTGLYWDDRTFIDWDSGKPQVAAVWSPVENGVYYGVDFCYAETENGVKKGSSGSRGIRQWGDEPLHDTLWDWLIGEYGNNWYFFQVQAFPANIEEYRVSEWSSFSIGYPMGFAEANAEAKLDNTINNLPTSGTLTSKEIEAVQNAVASIPLLDEAMMADNTNSGTVEKIETLEKAIGKADVDTSKAPAGFEADKVKVTGAVLNAGGDATLAIGKVDQNGAGGPSDLIHTQYNNTIPFTLNIAGAQDADGDPSNGLTLTVPVKITLPIPGNINPAFLVVLHYKQSTDQWEELHMPHVYQENGKWFASFTVTSMSPFSLAEKQVDVWDEGDAVRITAHLATGNDETQYLCAVYSTDGQMLGISILDPHSNSVRVELNQPIPDNYDVKIIAAASGNGWMPVGDAQTIEIRNTYE